MTQRSQAMKRLPQGGETSWPRRSRLFFVLPPLLFAVAGVATYAVFRRTAPRSAPGSGAESGEHATANAPSARGTRRRRPPAPPPDDMVWIPGGPFAMGGEASFTDALPVHEVELDGFWIDRTEVTNAQFARFVEATGYVTIAEQTPKAEDFPAAPPENLVAGSIVFDPPDDPIALDNHLAWWSYVAGADWKHPEGPGSDIAQRQDHPVVHVCWLDAVAYANWCDKRLPTEAEWESAARGGLEGQRFVWGDQLLIDENWQANIWQGRFPVENTAYDGFVGTAPVASFPPNGYGLYDMAGNVWEWCSDWYRPDYYAASSRTNPRGPPSSYDPQEPGVPKRVQRGGSYLCSDVYCTRYRPGARGKGAVDSGATHIGFRCAKDFE